METSRDTVIDSSKSFIFSFHWKELWLYRELFYFFTWRDIKVKYKQTVLGFLWVILQPLLMMVIFSFFFGKALGAPLHAMAYPIYVLSGLLVWNMFSTGLSNSATSMINNSNIIRKVYFPRIIVPISSILVALFDFVIALLIFIPAILIYGQEVAWSVIWAWPLAIVLGLAATIGPSCLLAALNVKYRDFRYIVAFLIQVLFFTSPVIYPLAFLKYPALQSIAALSPIYAALELFRYPLGGELPAPLLLMMSVGSALIFFVGGLVYFRMTENYFADLA